MLIRDKGNRLPKSVDIRSFNRPMKVAFLVPADESESNHWVLDGIFAESYSRWGGARSLIIPMRNGEPIDSRYETWLSYLDPDFIYSYVDLSPEIIDKLNRLALPISFIRHDGRNLDRWRELIPSWSTWIAPIPAASTLTSPYANYSGSQASTPQIYVNQHPDNSQSRFLPDNFAVGISPHAPSTGHPGIYETLCYTPTPVPENHIIGTYRCADLNEIITKLAKNQAKSFSRLSSIHSKGIIRPYEHTWASSFQIIIGESILDRINFWNVRHFSHGWSSGEVPSSLILSPSHIQDDEFCKAIGLYLNNHNFMGQNNGSPIVSINSFSLTRDECTQFIEKLNTNRNTWNQLLISRNFSELVAPDQNSLKQASYTSGIPAPSFKLIDSENEFVVKEPEHFQYLPPNFLHAKDGQWVIDFAIERHNDKSNVVNQFNDWKLPRRLEVLRAFSDNLGKVNKFGNLSLIPSSDNQHQPFRERNSNYKIQLSLPEDETVFRLLVLGFRGEIYHDYRKTLNRDSYYDIQLSDKGQNHRGVISKFHDVNQAADILTNKFWREILRQSSAEPDKSYALTQLAHTINMLDIADVDRIRKRMNLSDNKEVKKYLKNNLKDVIDFLIRSEVILQLHSWRCSYCGSSNKRSLETLTLKNSCDVCKQEYYCPIDFAWHYTPSRFVTDTLVLRSGLTVLWAISHLINRTHDHSSIYLPEIDLIKSSNYNNKNEVDILAVIDGRYYAGEVKYSVTDFINEPREIDIFIEEIVKLQPDVAVLAFEVYKHENITQGIEDIKILLDETKALIKEGIPNFVEFYLVVASDIPEFNNFPYEIGPWGSRTMDFLYTKD